MARKKQESGYTEAVPKIVHACEFERDGKCKGRVVIRINDSWMCNWHYENGYGDQIRERDRMHRESFAK